MASTRAGGAYRRVGVHEGAPAGRRPEADERIEGAIGGSAKGMLDDLDWWTRATMTARREAERKAA
jgi:hypothetical protein